MGVVRMGRRRQASSRQLSKGGGRGLISASLLLPSLFVFETACIQQSGKTGSWAGGVGDVDDTTSGSTSVRLSNLFFGPSK